MKRTTLCLLAGALLPITAASAQTMIDATDPDQIVNLIRGFGSAVLETDAAGDPLIVGRMEGTRFLVLFFGCNGSGAQCRSIQFRAAWETDGAHSPAALNAWNRDKRFAKAYLDQVEDPILEMDVNLFEGVTTSNLEDTIDWWQIMLADFKVNVLGE